MELEHVFHAVDIFMPALDLLQFFIFVSQIDFNFFWLDTRQRVSVAKLSILASSPREDLALLCKRQGK